MDLFKLFQLSHNLVYTSYKPLNTESGRKGQHAKTVFVFAAKTDIQFIQNTSGLHKLQYLNEGFVCGHNSEKICCPDIETILSGKEEAVSVT